MPDYELLPNPNALIPTPVYAALHLPATLDPPPASLASIAADFSPRYEQHGDRLVTIDVSGLDRLLGPPRAIGDELRRATVSRGLRVHVAVAGTPGAAIVLALARPGLTVVARGDEAAALAPLPIAILAKYLQCAPVSAGGERSECNVEIFSRWGLRTLGELAALPPAELVARCGAVARLWQAIARGDAGRPLVPTLPEERFESSLDLEWPIEGLEPLSFVLTRLLEPLSTRLERRDRGAAVLHVMLRLVTRDLYARRLELPSPMRDVRTLRTLALLDLDAHPPDAAIDRVAIVIDPTPGRVLQHALFTRAHPTPEQLSTLLARLGALMGTDRFGAPVVVDSYRPGAFAMAPFKTEHPPSLDRIRTSYGVTGARPRPAGPGLAGGAGDEMPQERSDPPYLPSPAGIVSALRRCRHPVPARVAVDNGRPVRVTTDRRGYAGGAVLACAGPWRSSGEWWADGSGGSGRSGGSGGSGGSDIEGNKSTASATRMKIAASSSTHATEQTHATRLTHPTCWDRDEWDVSLSDGGVYRIYRDRVTDAWFIDGIVD